MQVALNVQALSPPITGIGRYVSALMAHGARDPALTYRGFDGLGWARDQSTPVQAVSKRAWQQQLFGLLRDRVPASYAISRHLQQRTFSAGIKANTIDVYHEPNFLAHRFDGPTVVTVHDLSFIRHPEMHPKSRVSAMARYFPLSLERADAVITISEFVKQELIEVFDYPQDAITVTPLGADARFHPRPVAELEPVLAQFRLTPRSYFVTLGSFEPRKNLKTVVEAFFRLPQAVRARHPLVVVGPSGWGDVGVTQLFEQGQRSGQIRMLGFLDDERVAQVVAGARALLYPSVYEGFGLPPLEAMASGTPAIVSNRASLPEVVGGDGIILEALDVEAWTAAMARLVSDDAWVHALAESMLARSQQFSWASCAQHTFKVYQALLDRG